MIGQPAESTPESVVVVVVWVLVVVVIIGGEKISQSSGMDLLAKDATGKTTSLPQLTVNLVPSASIF